jgi:hypothetical protein
MIRTSIEVTGNKDSATRDYHQKRGFETLLIDMSFSSSCKSTFWNCRASVLNDRFVALPMTLTDTQMMQPRALRAEWGLSAWLFNEGQLWPLAICHPENND